MKDGVSQKVIDFFTGFRSKIYKPKEIILRPCIKIENIYFLKKGIVRQFCINENGIEITLHTFKPGSYFPIMLLIAESANKYNFQALDNVEVSIASSNETLEFVRKNPDVLFDLTRRMATGLNKLLLKEESMMFENSYEKVKRFVDYINEKFGEDKKKFTHEDIASWTGLTRETVSRQMDKLRKEGFIDQDFNFIKKS